MKVLVSVVNKSYFMCRINLANDEVKYTLMRKEFIDESVVGRALSRPFGISWDNDRLFIANNRMIHEFDKEFKFVRTLTNQLDVNSHQIACKDESIFVASPWSNCLIKIDKHSNISYFSPSDDSWQSERPVENPSKSIDVLHLNSLLFVDDRLYLNAHNHLNGSYIIVYKYPEFERIDTINTGVGTHNIAIDDGELFTLDTNGSKGLISSNGLNVPLGGSRDFLRGLAVCSKYIIIGVSDWSKHSNEDRVRDADGTILVLNRSDYKIVKRIILPKSGDITEIRLLDEFDRSHYVQPII